MLDQLMSFTLKMSVLASGSGLLLLAACSDKRADAGLTGTDQITSISKSGPGSLEPVFFYKITVDRSGRTTLSMENAKGRLPTRVVEVPSGTFESIAVDLAELRRFAGRARSECGGISDAGPVTVRWRYASGRVGSYSVMPGCSQRGDRRFLEAAASIARRVGLEPLIDRAPTPQ